MKTQVVRWTQTAALVVAVIFVAIFVGSQWQTLRAAQWRLHAGWLAISGLLLLATWGLEIGIWRNLLRHLGGQIPFPAAVRVWFLSAVVRYIPGNIWQPLSLTLYCRRWGIQPEATVTSIALYQVIILVAATPMIYVYALWHGQNEFLRDLVGPDNLVVFLTLLLPTMLVIVKPNWLVYGLNWMLRRLRRPVLAAHLSSPVVFLTLLLAFVDWILWGMTFAAFTFALGDYAPAEQAQLAPLLIASYPIAYAIGFLSLITPSGFGVREGAFYLLLAPPMDGAIITVIALAFRLWTTLGEVFLALVSALYERRIAYGGSSPVAGPEIAVDVDLQGKPT